MHHLAAAAAAAAAAGMNREHALQVTGEQTGDREASAELAAAQLLEEEQQAAAKAAAKKGKKARQKAKKRSNVKQSPMQHSVEQPAIATTKGKTRLAQHTPNTFARRCNLLSLLLLLWFLLLSLLWC